MRFFAVLSSLCLSSGALFGTSYYFVDEAYPFHLDTDGRVVGPAKFSTHHYKDSHVDHADSWNNLYYSFFINPKNSLSFALGYQYFKFDWDKNPRFREGQYHYGMTSLTWINRSMDKWRWVMTAGMTVDANGVNITKTAVGYGLLWGRYEFSDDVGVHIGTVGYSGMRTGYAFPILGVDWQLTSALQFHAIFPLDLSLRLYLHRHWFAALMYTGFGPYRYPRRAHDGVGRFKDAIFQTYSKGLELNFNYVLSNHIEAGIGAGWNGGGWILIKDRHFRHGKYYKFEGAPFGHAYFAYNF